MILQNMSSTGCVCVCVCVDTVYHLCEKARVLQHTRNFNCKAKSFPAATICIRKHTPQRKRHMDERRAQSTHTHTSHREVESNTLLSHIIVWHLLLSPMKCQNTRSAITTPSGTWIVCVNALTILCEQSFHQHATS